VRRESSVVNEKLTSHDSRLTNSVTDAQGCDATAAEVRFDG